MQVWCPLAIELLIHYCVTAGGAPFRTPSKASAENEILLEEAGLIKKNSYKASGYTSTKKGKFYLAALCRIPIPIERIEWIIPEE